jgi:hypothetical protein
MLHQKPSTNHQQPTPAKPVFSIIRATTPEQNPNFFENFYSCSGNHLGRIQFPTCAKIQRIRARRSNSRGTLYPLVALLASTSESRPTSDGRRRYPPLIIIHYTIIILHYNDLRYNILYHGQIAHPRPPINAPNRLLHSRPLLARMLYLTTFFGPARFFFIFFNHLFEFPDHLFTRAVTLFKSFRKVCAYL